MINDPLSVNMAIQVLNRFVAADPGAMRDLVESRVLCNQKLADDPTCQVADVPGSAIGSPVYQVGLVGVLNGLCGKYDEGPKKGWGPIAAVLSDDGKTLHGFRRTLIPGYIVSNKLPEEVRAKFAAFLGNREKEPFTICENDVGWFLFSLGMEGLSSPLFAVSKD